MFARITLMREETARELIWRWSATAASRPRVSEQTVRSLDGEVRENLLDASDRLSLKGGFQARLAELRDKLVAANGVWKADPQPIGPGAPPRGPHEAMPGHVMPFVHGLPFFSSTHQAWDAARAPSMKRFIDQLLSRIDV